MAQQATRKQTQTAPPVTRSPRLPKGKAGGLIDYARFRLTFTDADAFMDYMRGYPNAEGLTLFLYRLIPKINLSLIGKSESNIQKGGYEDLRLYTIEAVSEKFGQGKYNIKVTDSNRPEGQREVVRTCQYKISDSDKPPVYDVRTLELGHSDNIDEVNRLITMGVLVRDASGAPRLRTAADAAPIAPAAVPAATGLPISSDFFGQLLLSAFQKQQTPHDVVSDTLALAKLITPPAPPTPTIDQIADAVASRMGNGRGAAADPFSQWERVQGFVDKIKGVGGPVVGAVTGSDVAAADSSWAPHLANILAQARSFLPEVMGAFRELRATNGNGHGTAPAQQNGAGMQQLQPIEARIEQVFRIGFQKMQEGVTGFDYAAYVCFHMPGGLEVYQTLEPSGAQGLISLAAMNPAARPIVNDPAIRPKLEEFLTDFFSFVPNPDAQETAPASSASAAVA